MSSGSLLATLPCTSLLNFLMMVDSSTLILATVRETFWILDVNLGVPCDYPDYLTPQSLCDLCWWPTPEVVISGVVCSPFVHVLPVSQLVESELFCNSSVTLFRLVNKSSFKSLRNLLCFSHGILLQTCVVKIRLK